MAFAKKQKVVTHDGRPQGDKIQMREAKVNHLREANTPEARKALKQMGVMNYRTGRTMLGEWWNPKGKRNAKGSSVKATKINRVFNAKRMAGV